MSIEFKRTQLSGHMPTIWRGECKMLPAGFKPKQTFAVGTVLLRATPLHVDFADLSAAVVKVAKVVDGGTTTKPRIAKGSYFAVGDCVMKIGQTDKSPLITAIDTSNDSYDVLTLASAVTGLVADDVLQEASAYVSAEEPAAPLYEPNAIVGADCEFNGKGIPTIDAAYEAVVLYPNVSYPVREEWLNGFCLKSNPNIMFIKQ